MARRAPTPSGDQAARARQLSLAIYSERKALEMSQQTLTERAGVAMGTVRKIESGRSPEPGFFIVGRICWALMSLPDTGSKANAALAETLMSLMLNWHDESDE